MQRKDQRTPTRVDLDAYNAILKLTVYTMEACKPKSKEDKAGKTVENHHHVPARYSHIGEDIVREVINAGAYILEADKTYVGENIPADELRSHFRRRIELEDMALGALYRAEHMIRALHDHRPFADSTITYWVSLIVNARNLVSGLRSRDKRVSKGIG